METNTRLVAKALTWQATGLIVMTAIGYAITGSVGQGGTMALVGAMSGFVFYILHERLWSRIAWGRAHSRLDPAVNRL